jgi:uncharacterized protein YigA (DUF484 family)
MIFPGGQIEPQHPEFFNEDAAVASNLTVPRQPRE